jgi:hypothetical protein
LIEHRFPRIWVANAGQRDQRQLLVHRHRLSRCEAGSRTSCST